MSFAHRLASELAERIRDTESLGTPGLAIGRAGAVLLFDELSRQNLDTEWESVIDRFVQAMLGDPPTDPSLFGGWSGILAVLAITARPRHRLVMDEITAALEEYSESDAAHRHAVQPAFSQEYDWSYGIAGVGAALFLAGSAQYQRVRDRICEAICQSAGPDLYVIPDRPGRPRRMNRGLCHGLGGLLTMLVLGSASDIVRLAVGRIGDALLRTTDGVSMTGAWCYGEVAVASAIAMAAGRCSLEPLRDAAVDRLNNHAIILRDKIWAEHGLCHGSLGASLVLRAARQYTDVAALQEIESFWSDQAAAGSDENAQFFYRSVQEDGNLANDASFLTGAIGTTLALNALAEEGLPRWSILLGLPVRPRHLHAAL